MLLREVIRCKPLQDARRQQVVHIERADEYAVAFHHQKAVHMVLLHFFQGFGGETVGGDAFRVGMHHVVYRQSGKGFAFLE